MVMWNTSFDFRSITACFDVPQFNFFHTQPPAHCHFGPGQNSNLLAIIYSVSLLHYSPVLHHPEQLYTLDTMSASHSLPVVFFSYTDPTTGIHTDIHCHRNCGIFIACRDGNLFYVCTLTINLVIFTDYSTTSFIRAL